jgi:multidrug transporter EmrE-like cation transporter
MHSRDLLKSGLPVDKLVLVPVWHEAGDLFSARERAALAWAETVTRVAETGVPDADYAPPRRVQRQGAGRPHLCDRPDERLQPPRRRLPLDPRRRHEGLTGRQRAPSTRRRPLPFKNRRSGCFQKPRRINLWVAHMAWILLGIAGLLEIAFAFCMKSSEGDSRGWCPPCSRSPPACRAVFLLSLSLRSLPVGTGYAVWTGIGAAGTAYSSE